MSVCAKEEEAPATRGWCPGGWGARETALGDGGAGAGHDARRECILVGLDDEGLEGMAVDGEEGPGERDAGLVGEGGAHGLVAGFVRLDPALLDALELEDPGLVGIGHGHGEEGALEGVALGGRERGEGVELAVVEGRERDDDEGGGVEVPGVDGSRPHDGRDEVGVDPAVGERLDHLELAGGRVSMLPDVAVEANQVDLAEDLGVVLLERLERQDAALRRVEARRRDLLPRQVRQRRDSRRLPRHDARLEPDVDVPHPERQRLAARPLLDADVGQRPAPCDVNQPGHERLHLPVVAREQHHVEPDALGHEVLPHAFPNRRNRIRIAHAAHDYIL
mmetsp:Transcript_8260/g.25586  ORF Transcript_8260/g.25586 Transcript_8260/m.25586 type:complete len:335 (-) Transcript_8260:157-1161(-)